MLDDVVPSTTGGEGWDVGDRGWEPSGNDDESGDGVSVCLDVLTIVVGGRGVVLSGDDDESGDGVSVCLDVGTIVAATLDWIDNTRRRFSRFSCDNELLI